MERVFDVLPGAFLTQSVVVGRGAQPSLWRYQPVSTDTLRVQNLTTGVTFSLQRCSSPTAVDSRRSSGAAEASSQPSGPPSALSVQNAQRDVPPQRHPTMASRALAEEGDPEDLLILANVSPDAPNAAIDLGGQLRFPSGKAVLCSGPETEPGFDARMQAARSFATRKLFSSGAITSCRETSLERLDGVVISRQSIRRLEPAWFNDVAGRLQDGRTRAFVVVSKLDLQSGVDRRELGRTVTEQAIAAGRPGFGYASVPNASATACVVADPALEPAWTAIFEQRREAISLDLGRQLHPKPLMTDADTAYIGGRRGNCGMLIANAIQLATIFKAFERDQVKGKYGAVWFTAETIQNTAAAISSGTSAALQATEKARQSARAGAGITSTT